VIYSGESVAGLPCARGRAVYIDAEMGPSLFVDRLRVIEATGHEMDYFDAGGMDLSRAVDRDAIRREVEGHQLAILDSCGRLCRRRRRTTPTTWRRSSPPSG
jgi:hypothetical protein